MIELGLSRIAQLTRLTPLTWKAIHVAGTNGKGSITAYISALLEAAGIRTGRFNSPHLIDRWDCVSIQDRSVSQGFFSQVENQVKSRNATLGIQASEFELLTATAFEIFSRAHVQVGVVEVGLGGRLDATNILAPQDVLVSVISKIGLDHQELLGSDLPSIAGEKAGIMKEMAPCIADGTNESSVLQALIKHAHSSNTPLSLITPEAAPLTMRLLEPYVRDLNMMPHQIQNLLVAVEAVKVVEPSLPMERPIQDSLDVIPTIRWPGRLQVINIEPVLGQDCMVLLDGAHNTQAAGVLAAYVDSKIRSNTVPVTWILAASKGKDINGLVERLVRPQDRVIATQFGPVDGMPWVESVGTELIANAARAISGHVRVAEAETAELAMQRLKAFLPSSVIIAGSLYLVSDVLRLLERR